MEPEHEEWTRNVGLLLREIRGLRNDIADNTKAQQILTQVIRNATEVQADLLNRSSNM